MSLENLDNQGGISKLKSDRDWKAECALKNLPSVIEKRPSRHEM